MRRPVDQLAREPKPQGRPAMWAAIRKLRTFRQADVVKATDIPRDTVRTYVVGLQAAGFVQRGEDGSYTLVKDVGVDAPRVNKRGEEATQGAATEAMWVAMRILRSFSADELAAHATTPAVAVSPVHALDYCHHLARAGYLVRHGKRFTAVPGRYTGPKPPQVQRVKQIWDPNLQQVVWPKARDGEP